MKISKEDLLRINQGFGGNLRNSSSLDYAIDMLDNKKLGIYKKLAYLMRAVLVDHPFSDGNKRTAAFLASAFAEENHKQLDMDLLIHHITSIASQNITDIKNIDWRLKSCLK
jgi:prophage maintenance system killer protein